MIAMCEATQANYPLVWVVVLIVFVALITASVLLAGDYLRRKRDDRDA